MSGRILAATLRLLIVPHALGLAICILYLSFVFMFVFMIDIAFGLYCYCFSVACEVVDCAAQPQPWSGGCLHWDTARQSGPSTQILVHPPKYVPCCGNINVETRNTHQYRDTAGLEYKPSLARIEEWGRKNKMVLSIKYFEWWMTRSDATSTQVSSFVLWSWLFGNRLREVESVGGNQGESHLPTHCFLPSISALPEPTSPLVHLLNLLTLFSSPSCPLTFLPLLQSQFSISLFVFELICFVIASCPLFFFIGCGSIFQPSFSSCCFHPSVNQI